MTDWIDVKRDLPYRKYPAISCSTCCYGSKARVTKGGTDYIAIACNYFPKAVAKRYEDSCSKWGKK